jgi:hypothetical protein
MSKASERKDGDLSDETHDFSRDGMLEVLSNRRRRFAVHVLKQRREAVTVSDLAERIAGWENDKDAEHLTYQERKRVRNALRQFHLPKMDDYGFVEYDSQRGTVRLTDAAASTDFYVDSLTGRDVPWGLYYLGLSGLSAVCLAGIWLQVYPFTLLSEFAWGVFFVIALTVSSAGHFYDNYYRMRLGARDEPPEVGEE